MWLYFDTVHVNQHPMYMSKYPPAQGAALALGDILGHPWIGVLLSCAGMCATVLWALQGWLPCHWAFLGGLILLLRFGLFSYWINSYWGGAVAAIGGALVIGAFPRLLRNWRTRDAVLLGLGMAILANSRPFEGLVFSLPVMTALAFAWWKKRKTAVREALLRVGIPLCTVGLACLVFMGYYNWRGTGDPFLFPYELNNRTYLSAPLFVWQTPKAVVHHTNTQLDNFYNGWERASAIQGGAHSLQAVIRAAALDTVRFAYFFLWPELCFVAPALLFLLRDKKFRFLTVQLVICLLGFALVAWFQPHYAAPLTATMFAAIIQGLRHLRYLNYHGRPVGVGFSRVIFLSVVAFAAFHHSFPPSVPAGMEYRQRFFAQLKAMPDKHLVIVRYSTEHNALAEWVYNDADIDHSKVVWAREIPGADMKPLFSYFLGRRLWLVEPDALQPCLVSLSDWLPMSE
jgi:hypothetical protein